MTLQVPATETPRPAECLLDRRAAHLFDLSGHSIVVTGAAGGLGYQMAAAVASNGAHVTMIDIDADRLDVSVRGFRATGLSAYAVPLDVTNTAALERAIVDVGIRFGRLDAVFANAGISAGPGFGAGSDRTVGSLQSVDLVRQAAVELAPSRISVNAIAPGFVHTDIGGGRLNDAAVRDRLASQIPMARVGRADEVCGLALYLASPACSYMTGVTIPFDGGLTAC